MILHIHLKPQKKFNRIEQQGDVWQISIRARPQKNEANEYLVRYLSDILKLPVSAISIRRGHTSRIKQIEILGDKESIFEKLNIASQSSDKN
ncbi:MAG TPA: DUF167 domain-containing protein [Puia sp.]|nr:DUF167 domain-containing protein [Puia sp.]